MALLVNPPWTFFVCTYGLSDNGLATMGDFHIRDIVPSLGKLSRLRKAASGSLQAAGAVSEECVAEPRQPHHWSSELQWAFVLETM